MTLFLTEVNLMNKLIQSLSPGVSATLVTPNLSAEATTNHPELRGE